MKKILKLKNVNIENLKTNKFTFLVKNLKLKTTFFKKSNFSKTTFFNKKTIELKNLREKSSKTEKWKNRKTKKTTTYILLVKILCKRQHLKTFS